MPDIFRISMLPAQDGDCLLVELGDASSPYRILVDGGRAATADRLVAELQGFPARERPAIDLMVLTHVDADHIEGLLKLLVIDPTFRVNDAWFNGASHMAMARGIAITPRRSARRAGPPDQNTETVLSVAQGLEFGALLADRETSWNGAFNGAPVMTQSDRPLPQLAIAAGAQLTVLGPPDTKLAAVAPQWAAAFRTAAMGAEPTLRAGRPRPVPVPGNLPDIAKQLDVEDRTKLNGSSIAFAVTYKGKRALFAADAHPDDLTTALRRFEPGEAPVHFDVVKAAHHGSARNNTSGLLKLLSARRWLISTDGSRHQHPDPEAVARIVLSSAHTKELVFNYSSEFNWHWSNPTLQASYGFTAQYVQGEGTFRIDLLSD